MNAREFLGDELVNNLQNAGYTDESIVEFAKKNYFKAMRDKRERLSAQGLDGATVQAVMRGEVSEDEAMKPILAQRELSKQAKSEADANIKPLAENLGISEDAASKWKGYSEGALQAATWLPHKTNEALDWVGDKIINAGKDTFLQTPANIAGAWVKSHKNPLSEEHLAADKSANAIQNAYPEASAYVTGGRMVGDFAADPITYVMPANAFGKTVAKEALKRGAIYGGTGAYFGAKDALMEHKDDLGEIAKRAGWGAGLGVVGGFALEGVARFYRSLTSRAADKKQAEAITARFNALDDEGAKALNEAITQTEQATNAAKSSRIDDFTAIKKRVDELKADGLAPSQVQEKLNAEWNAAHPEDFITQAVNPGREIPAQFAGYNGFERVRIIIENANKQRAEGKAPALAPEEFRELIAVKWNYDEQAANAIADAYAKGDINALESFYEKKISDYQLAKASAKLDEEAAKSLTRKAQKAAQEEKRGIYNVTYNDKQSARISKDIEQVDKAIKYAKGNKNVGSKHIEIRHLGDPSKEGFTSDEELLNMGKNLRAYLDEYKEPYIDERGASIYEWENKDGVRFRLVMGNDDRGGTLPALSKPTADENIITFYSDRNLKNPMEFRNPAVAEKLAKRNENLIGENQLIEVSDRSARLNRHSDTSPTMATDETGSIANEGIIPNLNEKVNRDLTSLNEQKKALLGDYGEAMLKGDKARADALEKQIDDLDAKIDKIKKESNASDNEHGTDGAISDGNARFIAKSGDSIPDEGARSGAKYEDPSAKSVGDGGTSSDELRTSGQTTVSHSDESRVSEELSQVDRPKSTRSDSTSAGGDTRNEVVSKQTNADSQPNAKPNEGVKEQENTYTKEKLKYLATPSDEKLKAKFNSDYEHIFAQAMKDPKFKALADEHAEVSKMYDKLLDLSEDKALTESERAWNATRLSKADERRRALENGMLSELERFTPDYHNTLKSAENATISKKETVEAPKSQADIENKSRAQNASEKTTLKAEFAAAKDDISKFEIVKREINKRIDEIKAEAKTEFERIKNFDFYEFEIQGALETAERYFKAHPKLGNIDTSKLSATDKAKLYLRLVKGEEISLLRKKILRYTNDLKRMGFDIKFKIGVKEFYKPNADRFDKYLARYEKQFTKEAEELEKISTLTYDINTPKGEKAVRDLFYKNPHDDEQAELFEKVFATAKRLGVEYRHALRDPHSVLVGQDTKNIAGWYLLNDNSARVKHNGNIGKSVKGKVLLHELIHSVSSRALFLKEQGKTGLLNKAQIEALDEIEQIYKEVYAKADELGFKKWEDDIFAKITKEGESEVGDYGLKNTHEFLAELSNPVFREKLKKVGVFERVINAITKLIVGISDKLGAKVKVKGDAYTRTKDALYKLIDNYDLEFTTKYNTKQFGNVKMDSIELERDFLNKRTDRINISALSKEAVDLPKAMSESEFKGQFKVNDKGISYIKTPISDKFSDISVNVNSAWKHISGDNTYLTDRSDISGAFLDTLQNPLFVVKQKHRAEVSQNTTGQYPQMRQNAKHANGSDGKQGIINQDSLVFYKPYKTNDGLTHLASFTIDKNGKLTHKTFYSIENLGRLKAMIKEPDSNMIYYKNSKDLRVDSVDIRQNQVSELGKVDSAINKAIEKELGAEAIPNLNEIAATARNDALNAKIEKELGEEAGAEIRAYDEKVSENVARINKELERENIAVSREFMKARSGLDEKTMKAIDALEPEQRAKAINKANANALKKQGRALENKARELRAAGKTEQAEIAEALAAQAKKEWQYRKDGGDLC